MEAVQTRYLLADGAISTNLRQMTNEPDLVTETLCLTRPDVVLDLHTAFVDAGAQCLTTNSFSANATAQRALDTDALPKICEEAGRLARQAAGPDRYVLGSLGPWWQTGDGWEDAFHQQVRCLADSGVDVLVVETLTHRDAAAELGALARKNASKLPVFLSFSFKKAGNDFVLPGCGTPLRDVAALLPQLECAGYGVNCGVGLDSYDYATLISAFRENFEGPLMARPSAGDPTGEESGLPVYGDTPEYMAEAVWGTVRAGANIIGGCCGVTPEHIAAFKYEMDMLG